LKIRERPFFVTSNHQQLRDGVSSRWNSSSSGKQTQLAPGVALSAEQLWITETISFAVTHAPERQTLTYDSTPERISIVFVYSFSGAGKQACCLYLHPNSGFPVPQI